MPILTLTTDFGLKSFDVAALKGQLMCSSSQVSIVDISNDIESFNLMEAAYAMKAASIHFPANTIHFTNVNLKHGNNRILIVQKNDQYYICPDNGIINMMFPEDDLKAYVVKGLEKSFSYKNLNNKLCEIIKYAESNPDITHFGLETNSHLKMATIRAAVMPDLIRATVIYIDKYGNVVLNVTKDVFYNFIGERPFTITTRNYRAHKINKHYTEVEEGEMVCIFNDAGYLEIAINEGNASELMLTKYGNLILIEKE